MFPAPHIHIHFKTLTHPGTSPSYRDEMRQSVFCLAPLGHATWTIRAFEALMLGCIPVIIADDSYLPFQRWLDWPRFSVLVAERDVSRLSFILRAIPPEKVAALQRNVRRVWRHLAYIPLSQAVTARPADLAAFDSAARLKPDGLEENVAGSRHAQDQPALRRAYGGPEPDVFSFTMYELKHRVEAMRRRRERTKEIGAGSHRGSVGLGDDENTGTGDQQRSEQDGAQKEEKRGEEEEEEEEDLRGRAATRHNGGDGSGDGGGRQHATSAYSFTRPSDPAWTKRYRAGWLHFPHEHTEAAMCVLCPPLLIFEGLLLRLMHHSSPCRH